MAAQQAQVAASRRQSEVRGRQLARAQEQLIEESSRGDALLVQLQEKDEALDYLESQLAQAESALVQSREKQAQIKSGLQSGQAAATEEALQAATRNPAEYLDALATTGTVEVGKAADLVLLDADPLVDIRNTRRIAAVVRGGRLVERAELDALLADAAAAAGAD